MSLWASSIVRHPFLYRSPNSHQVPFPVHHQGIIHRDIKPANLLWTEDRQSVKICDFGVSHFTAAAASREDPNLYDEAGLTKTAGSPAFFAPEICHIPNFTFDESYSPVLRRGSQTSNSTNSPSSPQAPSITKQIDIWALGVTFYCLLFGAPPWQGQTEYAMFRAICNEEFFLPDTMCRDRVPTGGRDRKPEGREIGWCVVGLLEGLLEKDQEKRINLADMKVSHYRREARMVTNTCQRIPWIQNGVREPERWLRETTPSTKTRVVITDEDTKRALKPARFSYPGWVTRLTSTIKRVPLPLIPSSRTGSKDVAAGETKITIPTALSQMTSQPESLGRVRSSRTRVIMDRQLKRFAFGNASPTRSHTVPISRGHRRNSVGSSPQHSQSLSDPPSQINRHFEPGPSSRRSMALHTTGSSPRSRDARRQPNSLQLPGSSASISSTSSPTTPDEQPVPGRGLKMRISQVIRSSSVKKAVKSVKRPRSIRNDHNTPPQGRTSAETLDVLRASEDFGGLTPAMRASSWGSPGSPASLEDDDGRASLDLTVSEASGGIVQDFNKSVVRFGAGGYIDSPAVHGPAAAVYQPLSTPGASSSRSPIAGMTHSDSSSNSTATATTQQHTDSSHHMRVTSPLARGDGLGEDEGMSSDVFEETGTDDQEEDEEDLIHLRSRRPSAILSRSANASPLR